MDWLNYHHLLYFRTVVREGGIAPAARKLHLTHPTVSAQVRQLERALGEKLLERRGRRVAPTEVGALVYRYADEIFGLGRELTETLRGRPTGRALRLVVGIADVVPKVVAARLLAPTLALPEPVVLECREDKFDRLAVRLVRHDLDVVLSDAPLAARSGVRAFSHLLGECGISFLAAPALARRLAKGFPGSLDGAPFLLPTPGTTLRHSLDEWFDRVGVRPSVRVECEDSALMNSFGRDGVGALACPTAIADDVAARYGLRPVGAAEDLRERYYAVTVERRIRHPAVAAISEAARVGLFA